MAEQNFSGGLLINPVQRREVNLCCLPVRRAHARRLDRGWTRRDLNKKLSTWPGKIKEDRGKADVEEGEGGARARGKEEKSRISSLLLRALVFCPLEFPGSFSPRPAICLVLQLCDRLFLDYGVTRYPLWYTHTQSHCSIGKPPVRFPTLIPDLRGPVSWNNYTPVERPAEHSF